MTLKQIIEQGYAVTLTGLEQADYTEDPSLVDVDAYRVEVITPDQAVYRFNFEFDADFDEALEEAFEYVQMMSN